MLAAVVGAAQAHSAAARRAARGARNSEDGFVMLDGQMYIQDMVKRYLTDDALEIVQGFKAYTPCDEGIMQLTTVGPRQDHVAASLTRSVIMAVAYAAERYKPECLFHVGMVQRFASDPCFKVYKYAEEILPNTCDPYLSINSSCKQGAQACRCHLWCHQPTNTVSV